MTYKIKPYSYKQAKLLGVKIKPSTNPKKKIDVFKNNEKIASIGAINYMDFPQYLEIDKHLAEKKRINYWKRHYKHINIEDTPSFYAGRILW